MSYIRNQSLSSKDKGMLPQLASAVSKQTTRIHKTILKAALPVSTFHSFLTSWSLQKKLCGNQDCYLSWVLRNLALKYTVQCADGPIAPEWPTEKLFPQ